MNATLNMTVRNVPADLVAFIRETAAKNRRSLNSQAVVALDEFRTRSLAGAAAHVRDAEAMTRRAAELRARFAANQTPDSRSADEILGYDAHGLPR